jgi:excisionase family DNA binding protein
MSDQSTKEYCSTDPPPGFVTKKQCAKHLGKHPNTIDRMRQRRMIPYYRIGGSVMFKLAEVEAALARFRVREVAL